MKSTRYKETEDQMSIKNYGGSNHKTEYDYDEKKWWDEIQTSNSHKQWTLKLKETSSPYATMCTPRLGVMMMMMMMMMMMWWDEMQTYNKSIKSDNLQLIYKIIHTTYKKSIKTYNPLQEIYTPSLQVVYPPYQHHHGQCHHRHLHHHHWQFHTVCTSDPRIRENRSNIAARWMIPVIFLTIARRRTSTPILELYFTIYSHWKILCTAWSVIEWIEVNIWWNNIYSEV